MNRWLLLYDDGKASRIRSLDVEADTMPAAIEKSGLPVEHIWACAVYGNLGAAATVMLRTMKQNELKNKAKS
jgi:hypothetical protein